MPDTSGTNYSFLNDYISKIIGDSDKVDNNVSEEDDDHFYDVPDEDDTSDENNDIQYSMNSNEDDNSDEGARLANDYLHETGDPDTTDSDYDTEDDTDQDSIYGQGDTGSYSDSAPSNPDYSYVSRNEDPENSDLGSKIASKESQGKYAAFNSAGGGAGAVGKYQFRWNIWKDSIQKVTGVKSKDEFLNNPQAQEKYYGWYEKNYLIPVARKLQPYNKKGLSEDQMAELVHFRGEDGAKKYLQGTAPDKPERYNMSTSKYIATKQHGGGGGMGGGGGGHAGGGGGMGVAMSASAQHTGLNNSSFDHMLFPMHGENEFRGLDDGSEVYLEDEYGKKKKLKGKHHKTTMRGHVFETRLNR
jgi:hypothetical protein